MLCERPTIQLTNASAQGSASQHAGQQRKMKLALLVLSLAFSAATFLVLDWFHSRAVVRAWRKRPRSSCMAGDPGHGNAFTPNCTSPMLWGAAEFQFTTNSLGLRDERVRQVPLRDQRPRLLMLGNSFTQGLGPWNESYVGRIAAHFPQYDVLNAGAIGYSPSFYLVKARSVLAKGVAIDEVIVFIGVTDVHNEAAVYHDVDASGAVAPNRTLPPRMNRFIAWYHRNFMHYANSFMLTRSIVEFFERTLIRHGCYFSAATRSYLPLFDNEPQSWTYRAVDPAAWRPLGLDGGIAKAEAKMDLLRDELARQGVPISVVVYPYAPQLLHDTVDSRQVRVWREWCAGRCKRFITVFPEFFAAKDACPRLQPGCWYLDYFIFGDSHYNAAGNALVADAVIESLAKDPPVKAVAR
jgi:hypothetical protein